MAEPKENLQMEKIVSLCKRRGFIFQSSEIYGGINGFWDYGPLGAELKRNVKELWWHAMTRQRDDVAGLEATIIMSPEIWKASGHVDTFSDPMCDCLLTKKRFRADQIEPQSGQAFYFLGAIDKLELQNQIQTLEARSGLPVGNFVADRFQAGDEAFKMNLKKTFGGESLNDSEFVQKLRSTDYFQSLETIKFLLDDQKSFSEAYLGIVAANFWDEMVRKNSDEYSVLVEKDDLRKAQKVAIQFYRSRGIIDPYPVLKDSKWIENSTRYNPENGSLLTEPRPFNLMFKTYVGPVDSEDNVAYLRPETAQAIFAQFKNVLETSRQKVPFGIGQIGKAFRNEVTPRNYTFRSREFEQMELEFFIKPDEVVEAICGKVSSFKTQVSSNPPDAALETSNLNLETPQPDWGWEAWHKYWVEERIRFYEGIGLPRHTLVEYWQTTEELAHYARACVDILFKFPFSKRDENGELKGEELEGIAARSDFDLSQHQRFSGKPMGVFDEELRAAWGKLSEEKKKELRDRYFANRKKYLVKTGVAEERATKDATNDADGLAKGQYIPHVIEPSAGVDRLILALICNAYSEETKTDEKGKSETTVVMRFHPRVAPVKVGVLPLLKNKPALVQKAREVRDLLRPWMNVFYDDGGSIGRRYARQDEAGTPFCVTIDFDTLGEKPELLDTVTIRYRDDGRQERLKISELLDFLLSKIR